SRNAFSTPATRPCSAVRSSCLRISELPLSAHHAGSPMHPSAMMAHVASAQLGRGTEASVDRNARSGGTLMKLLKRAPYQAGAYAGAPRLFPSLRGAHPGLDRRYYLIPT